MKNLTLPFIVLCLLLISCGKKGGDSSSSDKTYQYGSVPLPGQIIVPDDNEYSPLNLSDKVFTSSGNTYAPMDFLTQELTLTFDPVAQTAKGHSVIKFALKKTGRPYFEVQATVTNARLNSESVSVTSLKDPDGQNQTYRAFTQELEANVVHVVEFDYTLPTGRVSYTDGGARFLTDMTDLSGKFFEYWGPTGFEEDGFAMDMVLKVENSTATHHLYTNGAVTEENSKEWKIKFPNFFTKSSFYVHLTNQVLPSQEIVYKGLEKDIPIKVYGLTSALVSSAIAQLPKLFAELEGDYGPYPHDKFLAYMNDRSGGMEYVGATITSLASIDHELLHSWFARGMIPADGRSGWIDEAMASWRDYGYSKATSLLGRTPTNLANYSPYRKTTPSNAYVDGRALMAELDRYFADFGGLKPLMREFISIYKYKVVTNEEFWNYLATRTNLSVEAFNQRYALGKSTTTTAANAKLPATEEMPSKHPTPLTQEEILRLR